MRMRPALLLASLGSGIAALAFGCAASDTDTDTPTGSPAGTATGSGTGAGTGGGGGAATGTGTGTGSGVGGGGGSTAVDPCPEVGAPHLLIAEVCTHGPSGNEGNHEFIEIRNPTGATVDLGKYYLSDNNVYYRIAYGQAFNPTVSQPGTDFLVKFPGGASLAAGATVVIQAGPDFEAAWSSCADYAIGTDTPPSCGSGTTPLMEEPTNGDRGSVPGSMLTNEREMVVLFCWDGQSSIVKDVDYVAWGDSDETPSRIDKTGQPGYAADTAIPSQADAPRYYTSGSGGGLGQSLGRDDDTETAETSSNGNGPAGHDETSEDFAQTILICGTGTPGAANSCP